MGRAHAQAACRAAALCCAPRREVTEGLSPQCPLVFDVEANTTREEEGCAKRLGVVSGTHCDIKNQVGLLGGRWARCLVWSGVCVCVCGSAGVGRV